MGSYVTGLTVLFSYGFAVVGLGTSSRIYIVRKDWFFFVASLATIPVWIITGNPLYSIILATAIDAIAFGPTFRKTYFHPETESSAAYALGGLKFLLGTLALENFTVTTMLYPLSLVFMNGVFIAMLYWRKQSLNKGEL